MKAKNNSFSAKITVDLPKMRQTLGKSPINSRIKGKNDQIPKKKQGGARKNPKPKKKKGKRAQKLRRSSYKTGTKAEYLQQKGLEGDKGRVKHLEVFCTGYGTLALLDSRIPFYFSRGK